MCVYAYVYVHNVKTADLYVYVYAYVYVHDVKAAVPVCMCVYAYLRVHACVWHAAFLSSAHWCYDC